MFGVTHFPCWKRKRKNLFFSIKDFLVVCERGKTTNSPPIGSKNPWIVESSQRYKEVLYSRGNPQKGNNMEEDPMGYMVSTQESFLLDVDLCSL